MPVVPTRRLAVVAAAAAMPAAAAVAALGLSWWVSVASVSGTLVVLGLIDAAAAVPPSRVRCTRSYPASVVVDTPIVFAWQFSNASSRPVRVAVADAFAPSLSAQRRAQVSLEGGGRAEVSTPMRPSRRGRFELDALVVRVQGPLGLAARQQVRRDCDVLRVVPPFRSKREIELRMDQTRLVEVGIRSARGRGGGTDFDQLREYVLGDDHRRIDWGATARFGHPIIRTYMAEQHQNVVVLLDNGRVMAGRIGDVPRAEYAMDAAMALAAAVARTRDRFGLLTFDRRIRSRVDLGTGTHQVRAVTEAVFDLETELSESDYVGAITDALVRYRRRSLFVLITELAESVVIDTVAPAIRAATRRHEVIVASVRDPTVARWATADVTTGDESFRAVAATAALTSRARGDAALRTAGATVIDAEPDRLAWLLVQAYLELKASGRW